MQNTSGNGRSGTSPTRFNRNATLAQLDRLGDLPEDWNGYRAQKIDKITIEAVKQFKELPDEAITTPFGRADDSGTTSVRMVPWQPKTYMAAVRCFLAWADERGVGLSAISP